MKKYFLILALVFICYSASAQATFGPRIAFNSSNLNIRDNITSVEEGDAEFGLQYGVFARFKVPIIGLYAQPEILVSNSKTTITSGTQNVDLSFNRVDVPVMLGGKVGPLRVNAGPVLSFLSSAESDVQGTIADIKDNYSNTTVGFQAGVGLDISKLVIDLKYEGALGEKFSDQFSIAGNLVSTDERASQLVLAVGFKLF